MRMIAHTLQQAEKTVAMHYLQSCIYQEVCFWLQTMDGKHCNARIRTLLHNKMCPSFSVSMPSGNVYQVNGIIKFYDKEHEALKIWGHSIVDYNNSLYLRLCPDKRGKFRFTTFKQQNDGYLMGLEWNENWLKDNDLEATINEIDNLEDKARILRESMGGKFGISL